MIKFSHLPRWIACIVAVLASLPAMPLAAQPVPKPGHVFIIVLENEGYHITFGPKSPANYLKHLARQGALLPNYYGIGHFSLDNYIAMISGQAPNPATQADCQKYTEFTQTSVTPDGQAVGSGCVYPAAVQTVANQLTARGLTWKAYMEDMGNMPLRESPTCGHPAIGAADDTQIAVRGDQYASRHNPFVYFHAIIDTPACYTNVVNLSVLQTDLQSLVTTPAFAFITPNLCDDGHDPTGEDHTCVNGDPGGLVSADKFLAGIVPQILASAAFKQDGLLIITFDEADIDVSFDKATGALKLGIGDASACCAEPRGPNIPLGTTVFNKIGDTGPGVGGPGGGRIGSVLVSRFIRPGTVSYRHYNHYALLRSLEDAFGLNHLGYAEQKGLNAFGSDVFTRAGG
jgi:phosphatidylinositol-3-phosphatase